ncbi:YitT family protein [Aneurinibacillus sp. Ricciae_BoGa-3]|uniref:YitT family protein n=1 Tax=Aneurinibacillus sp. Ricciae_BoGa-3 TaxID=3022697 RepID=UPI002341F14D|nr:YitT family protein [Aneurinibacillus sp. Ricciae_BoGa-3]WCK56405.1 YitT family protein [Aneurinibacillus sp. Ricciae_BoGa-3]
MRYVKLFFAILSFAVGNLLFAVPNHIMNGGMTGLSLMVYYLFHNNIGLNLFLFNLPLFILAFIYYRPLFYNSVISMTVLSVLVGILQNYLIPFGIHNIWVGSVVGGLWMGISLGILAKMNASLGGGSLLGKMINLRYGYSLSTSIFLVDASVYPLSFFLIGGKETLFSLILTAASAFGVYLFGRVGRPSSAVTETSNEFAHPLMKKG